MKEFERYFERERFFAAERPSVGEISTHLFPIQLPDEFRELLGELGFSFDVATRIYTCPELVDITMTCQDTGTAWSFITITLTKAPRVDTPSSPPQAVAIRQRMSTSNSIRLFRSVLEQAGYNVDALLRLRKLRALLS